MYYISDADSLFFYLIIMHADNASSYIKARKLVHVKYGNIR